MGTTLRGPNKPTQVLGCLRSCLKRTWIYKSGWTVPIKAGPRLICIWLDSTVGKRDRLECYLEPLPVLRLFASILPSSFVCLIFCFPSHFGELIQDCLNDCHTHTRNPDFQTLPPQYTITQTEGTKAPAIQSTACSLQLYHHTDSFPGYPLKEGI